MSRIEAQFKRGLKAAARGLGWTGLVILLAGTPDARADLSTLDSDVTVLRPLTVKQTNVLKFFFKDCTTTSCTLVAGADGSCTVSAGKVTSPACQPAEYTVNGTPSTFYSIAWPSTIRADLVGGTTSLVVTNVHSESNACSKCGSRLGRLDSFGSDLVRVGGTITFGPFTPGGTYEADFMISVNY